VKPTPAPAAPARPSDHQGPATARSDSKSAPLRPGGERGLEWATAALIVASAGLNLLGYVLNLYRTIALYDEGVHALSIGTLCLAAGLWGHSGLSRSTAAPVRYLALLGTGLLAGLAWEFFEWAIGIIGDRTDTLIDLLMDGLGAAAAALMLGRWGEARDARRR